MNIRGKVTEHIAGRRMPVGRYLYALEDMLEIARDRGLGEVERAIEVALEQGRKAKRLEFSYNQTRDRTSKARGRSVVLDNQIDTLITSIRNLVQGRILGDGEDPVDKAAKKILDAVFPRGVQEITRQSFETQLATMTVMLELFHGELAEAIRLTGVEREVARLDALVAEFRRELRITQVQDVTYDEVQEALTELHEQTAIVRAICVATYPSLGKQATQARETLLAPLVDQEERVAESQRRHRRILDVDPATGEEIADDEALEVPVEGPVPGSELDEVADQA